MGGQFVEVQPLYSAELSDPLSLEMGREYDAALHLATGSPVYDTYQNHDWIVGGSLGTIAERDPNLGNAPEFYDGDFSLAYLPVIDRADPYTQGLRR